jgi:thiamine biosynthesis protein ThiI
MGAKCPCLKRNYFIIHYGEIALKGKNRDFFESRLILNIKKALSREDFDFIKKISGRLILKLNEKSNIVEIKNKLKKIFGIAYFCESLLSSQNLEVLQKDAMRLIKNLLSSLLKRGKKGIFTFKIQTQRSNKDYPLTSWQINEKIGEYVLKNYGHRESVAIDLESPDIICFIEIVENYVFIYFEKMKGAGGMPTTTAGKIISLISSGFDSPVASYFLARRGAEIIFLHFESTPQTSSASIENVKNLVKKLTEYQLTSKLYLVPFLEIQKEIIRNCQANLAVILYRRMMVRIACEIAKKEMAKAIVTGDNLGQVASQTLENIEVINKVSNLPIFRPLIGFDKEEIINFARKIFTYEISSRSYEDCCSLFVPRHPETRARLEEVKDEEKKLNIKKLIDAAIKKAKTEEFSL